MKIYFRALLLLICIGGCSSHKSIPASTITVSSGKPVAFPGAEGFGKYVTGGRGGLVYIVSNLNDNGAGSLREALAQKHPRFIVFSISGTIHLQSPLVITSDVTIAGQTAPGDGICIADHPVQLKGNNIIVRFLRIRMGDRYQQKGLTPGSGSDDAFGGTRCRNLIIDHCSMSWSEDEVCSVYAGDSTTLQWNIISEPLNYSYHVEEGDKDFERHGYGGIWGGAHTSGHHNLFAHCVSRTPRFDGQRNIPLEFVDFRNNVIYNWASNNVYAGEAGRYNIVNNYYKPGPSTSKAVTSRLLNPYKRPPDLGYGKFFVQGNVSAASAEVSRSNWLGVVMNEGSASDTAQAKSMVPFSAEEITTHTASEAYQLVLSRAGAILPKRDTLDQRIVDDVKNGKGRIIDVQGGFPHGTVYSISQVAWPVLNTGKIPQDSDADGMPDDWEKKNGLNPANALDASAKALHSFYTNIEVYVNSLVVNSE